jgi:hypothetical protein
MREMMVGTILPELSMLVGPASLVSRTLRVYGLAESRISELLDDLFHASSNPTVAYLAGGGEVHVRLTAKGTRAEANALLDPLEGRVRERLGDHVSARGTSRSRSSAAARRQLTIAAPNRSRAADSAPGSQPSRASDVFLAPPSHMHSRQTLAPRRQRGDAGVRAGQP